MTYKSSYTGNQIDTAVGQVLNDNSKVQYGNIIGNLANQADLITAINDAKSIRLTLETENDMLVLKNGTATVAFNDLVTLIFTDKKSILIQTSDTILIPVAFNLHSTPAFIIFAGEASPSNPGANYLRIDNTDNILTSSFAAESIGNKIISISASSTDIEYPSAKSVYDLVDTALGDISEALEGIIGESI